MVLIELPQKKTNTETTSNLLLHSLRMVLGIPRYCSASEMFAYTNVPSCQCVIRLNIQLHETNPMYEK